jgi:hypothetical protein
VLRRDDDEHVVVRRHILCADAADAHAAARVAVQPLHDVQHAPHARQLERHGGEHACAHAALHAHAHALALRRQRGGQVAHALQQRADAVHVHLHVQLREPGGALVGRA